MLWVETQGDGIHAATTMLVNSFFISDKKILANYRILEDGVSEDFEILGKYATIERANEVYNEMVALLKDPFTDLQDAEGHMITVPVPWHYYKMPEK